MMGAIVLSAAGFMAGYYTCQASLTEKTSRKSVRAKEREAALMGREKEFKLILCVRMDLKMGKGKIAAQCSHATLGIYKKLARYENLLSTWESTGQAKVVVKVECEEDMIELQEKAKEAGLPCHVVIDAGRTQIAPNSRTVLAVLGPTDLLDSVTGHLKLL